MVTTMTLLPFLPFLTQAHHKTEAKNKKSNYLVVVKFVLCFVS